MRGRDQAGRELEEAGIHGGVKAELPRGWATVYGFLRYSKILLHVIKVKVHSLDLLGFEREERGSARLMRLKSWTLGKARSMWQGHRYYLSPLNRGLPFCGDR